MVRDDELREIATLAAGLRRRLEELARACLELGEALAAPAAPDADASKRHDAGGGQATGGLQSVS